MRMPVALVIGVLLAATAACTTGEKPAPQCDSKLDAAFGAWARAGFSGAVAASTGGRFECLAGYGTADDATGARNTADTVYSIGSVSKAFTATAILKLAEDGKLSLDDPVGKLVPAITGPVAKATVRQVLLHTSGIGGSIGADDQPLDRAGAIAAINKLELAFPPGTDDAYSNAGYTLLAIIIDTVSGMSYRDYTLRNVLTLPGGAVTGGFWHGRPAAAGPVAAGYLDDGKPGRSNDFPGPYWTTEGNGSLAMSTRELATWAYALFRGALAKHAGDPGHPVGDGRSHTLGGWMAFDAPVYGTPIVAIAGGGGDVGHNTAVVWIPARDQVIVMSSNRSVLTAEELLAATVPSLVAGGALPTPTTPAGGGDPAAVVGTYRLDTGGSFEVTVAGNQPRISAVGADAVGALFPPRHRFSADDLRAHEKRVLLMLDGQTKEGREERKAVEAEYGPIAAVAGGGTVVADGEMRTYVTVTTRDGPRLGWYAVDEHSNIEGAELPTDPPALTLVPVAANRYRPDDPTGTGPDVTLDFAGGKVTVSGPAGTATARKSQR
ncbi:serine hydrolase domain-containing protein [Actinoplanes aureus]|uniref:Beta-lactamase family protein n=1 Tax=Actinoplanes aureus TaxID=2792083 RepID=A0A931G2Y2_9ACTN|nr:serine hydrolase domain-containing protein [Actinoplanes aureus]MBG0566521.1 beta-lactamase family protein [Actinoplanes aureus]